MKKTYDSDFEYTGDKTTLPVETPPSQDELDSIEYVLPVKKKRKKHKTTKNEQIISNETYTESVDYVYARPQNKKKKRQKKIKKIIITIVSIILALVIACAATFFIFNEVGKRAMHDYKDMTVEPSPDVNNIDEISEDGKTITYKGKTYAFNENVTTVALLGIDNENFEYTDRLVGEGGQADAIYIAVVDTSNKKVSILGVSRDTMVDVNIYNTDGGFVGTDNMQICLSHAYGDGAHTSCENTMVSLERLFYGIQYNTYLSIDIRALETLTDAVGGVTITALSDFYSDYYARDIKKGETITIYGNDAIAYVRSRDVKELDSNNDRMARQKQFITAFIAKIWDSVKNDPGIVLDLYSEIADKSTTNLTPTKMTYLASTAISGLDSYKEIKFVNVPGNVKKGDYAEFIVDQDGLMEVILDLFYVQVK